MNIRTSLVKALKNFVISRGFILKRLSRQLGLDPFLEINRLSKTLNYPIETVFDVGANDGDTAVDALEKFPAAQVFGFEPHPSTFAELLTRMGPQPRFHPQNVGLADQSGELDMAVYFSSKISSFTPDAGFVKRFGFEATTLSVKVTTIDLFCAENSIDRIDVLKIDTEGYELVVLHGAVSMLAKRAIRFIYLEYNDLAPKEGAFGGALIPIEAYLRPFGFRYMASYNDSYMLEGDWFLISNALFALTPDKTTNE